MGAGSLGPWVPLPWFLLASPDPGPNTLARPRIAARLDEGLRSAPVVVLSAPSGFGKTVAAADWARSRPGTQWVSAVPATDTATLIRGCVLASLPSEARAPFVSVDPEERSPHLREALVERGAPLTLVIDDAHLLLPETVRALLLDEATLRSGLLRVVLVGQSVLRAQYARELATGLAAPIGAEEIALSSAEVADLLALASPASPVDAGFASDVFRSSGGWAIAVRLAARAPAGSTAEPSLLRADAADEGTDSLLTDYIDSAVLDVLPAKLREFVLATTTCTRIDAVLAERLSGRADAAALLESCVAQGLFLERFETSPRRVVYRWHDTFARHCQALLRRRDAAGARRLHRDAADLLANAFPAEAIRHALDAGDPELAVRIISRNWLRLILDAQVSTLDSLCLSLPEPWRDDPAVLLIRACCLDLSGDADTAAVLRAGAARAIADDPRLEYVRSFADVLLTPDPERKAVAADRAHDLLAERADADPHALFVLGWAELRLRRDPFRAIELLTSAQHEASRHGLRAVARKAQENAVFASAYAGDFAAAEAALIGLEAEDPGERTAWELYDGGVRGLTRSYIHYWRGDFAAALEHCDLTIAEGGAGTSFLGLARVYRVLAIAALGAEQLRLGAERTLAQIPEYDKHGVPWGAYRRMAGARLLEAQGRNAEARTIADPLLNRSRIPVTHALLADLYRRIGQPALAFLALSKIKRRERPGYAHVSALVTFAALKFTAGEAGVAHAALERALECAGRDLVLAPFLGPDPELAELLAAHARIGTPHETLLAGMLARRERAGRGDRRAALTRREQELLGFLRTTMTAQEIADALHLSLATVKTHQRTLYRKLGVNSRRGAVRAAP